MRAEGKNSVGGGQAYFKGQEEKHLLIFLEFEPALEDSLKALPHLGFSS